MNSTSTKLLDKRVGDYLCETVDVSEVDTIQVDSDGTVVTIGGWSDV